MEEPIFHASLRRLVASAQERLTMHAELEALAIEGIESGPATPLTADDWVEVRRLAGLKPPARGE